MTRPARKPLKVGDEVLAHCKIVDFDSVGRYVLRPLIIGNPTFKASDGEVLRVDEVTVKHAPRPKPRRKP